MTYIQFPNEGKINRGKGVKKNLLIELRTFPMNSIKIS